MRTTFLVFGLTGDLMKKKGLPALFALWKRGKLPKNFRIVGLSRKTWSNEAIKMHLDEAVGADVPAEFTGLFSIFTGEGESAEDVARLAQEFSLVGDTLYIYLCVSPELYTPILKNGSAAGLFENLRALLIEKPFGSDGASARELQALLRSSSIPEEKIYRLDHFLAKEAMRDLSALSGSEVQSIEVYLNEQFGVESRGAMYDPVGALRDVGQNHLLEAAAAVLGDRARALEELHILPPEEVATHTVRGQYEGYRSVSGVVPDSQTETYFKVESYFEHAGRRIPLTLESGKLMPNRREVVVTLADGEKVIPLESGTNEYEILFAEAFAGDRSHFVSMREVEALWKFTDPIEASWKNGAPRLVLYKPVVN